MTQQGYWRDGELPANVLIGRNSLITDKHVFDRFRSQLSEALIIGEGSTLRAVHLALGKDARLHIGDYCYLDSCIFLCDLEINIGNYVVIGWNCTIADSDFHPTSQSERLIDAIACSPSGNLADRPSLLRRAVTIENDVWIGPNATILKGVTIGCGARVEAGSVVTVDVPRFSYVQGNPASMVNR